MLVAQRSPTKVKQQVVHPRTQLCCRHLQHGTDNIFKTLACSCAVVTCLLNGGIQQHPQQRCHRFFAYIKEGKACRLWVQAQVINS